MSGAQVRAILTSALDATRLAEQDRLRQTPAALHLDRDVIRTYRDGNEKDLTRLNQEIGRLRDAIGAQCGAAGRRWHQALMERPRAGQDSRR